MQFSDEFTGGGHGYGVFLSHCHIFQIVLIHNNITFLVHINNHNEANLLVVIRFPPSFDCDYLIQMHTFLCQSFMEICEGHGISPVLKHIPSGTCDRSSDLMIGWIFHPHVDIPVISGVTGAPTILTEVFAFHQIYLSVSAGVAVLIIVYLEVVGGNLEVSFNTLIQIDI
jgi:hypothetical protein